MAAEKLTEHHGCSVSLETLRGWMIVDGPGRDRRHGLRSPHQPLRRRDCLGPPSALVGLEQLPACTGPSQATQASRINGVVRRVHGTLFAALLNFEWVIERPGKRLRASARS